MTELVDGTLTLKVHIAKTSAPDVTKPRQTPLVEVVTHCGQRGVGSLHTASDQRMRIRLATGTYVEVVPAIFKHEATCKVCLKAVEPPPPVPLSPRDEALITMIYEALRWTAFSVGEGLSPAADIGECIEPDVILLDYWEACGRDHELEYLPALIRDHLRARFALETTKGSG